MSDSKTYAKNRRRGQIAGAVWRRRRRNLESIAGRSTDEPDVGCTARPTHEQTSGEQAGAATVANRRGLTGPKGVP
jgi:hypothetical protein